MTLREMYKLNWLHVDRNALKVYLKPTNEFMNTQFNADNRADLVTLSFSEKLEKFDEIYSDRWIFTKIPGIGTVIDASMESIDDSLYEVVSLNVSELYVLISA